MSDYHEMYENWIEGIGHDPAYTLDEDEDKHDNKPVNPDDWADKDFDGD